MGAEKKQEKNKQCDFITLSKPDAPGMAMLQLTDPDGAVVFQNVFSTEEWQEIDKAMRYSLGKYKN